MKAKSDSSPARWVIAAFLVAVGLYFMWEVFGASRDPSNTGIKTITTRSVNGSITRVAVHSKCMAPKESTTVVKIYPSDENLSLQMYTFNIDDLSQEVTAHANKKGSMAGAPFHKFYAEHLCGSASATAAVGVSPNSTQAAPKLSPAPGSCKGTVLDVGAFIGTQALVLAKMGFEVHAFEPQAAAAELLRCSVMANRMTKLHVIAEGISDAMGEECMISPMAKLQHQAMMAPKALSKAGCDPASKVPVVTLNHYWRDVLNSTQVKFIKISAEGHELFILAGGMDLFRDAPPPFVSIDFDPRMLGFKNITSAALLTQIDAAGYRIYDCQAETEVTQGRWGEAALNTYLKSNSKTNLLLVHKKEIKGGATGKMPTYTCDRD